jgi:hypothetical protein
MTSHAADALTASSFSLTVDGVEIGQFSELVELKSEIDPSALASPPDTRGTLPTKKVPARQPVATPSSRSATREAGRSLATTSRTRGRRRSRSQASRPVRPRCCTRPSRSSASEVLYETVTLVCENLERVNP